MSDGTTTKACPFCGGTTNADDRFCRQCGQSLDASPAPAAPEAAEMAPRAAGMGCLLWMLGILVAVALLLGGTIAVNRWRAASTPAAVPAAPASATYGTLIGYTEVTTSHHVDTIDINDVPSGHYPFHAVATLKEGTRVQILQHDQNDALIVAPDGTQGYVGIDSIRELCGNECPPQ